MRSLRIGAAGNFSARDSTASWRRFGVVSGAGIARKHEAGIQRVTEVCPSCGILVVDDHGIVREGLIALLKCHSDIQVLGSAVSGAEAIVAAQRLKPSIIIMDLLLPDMSGIEATKRILAFLPLTRVIMLSAR